jgi:hypothetical protein
MIAPPPRALLSPRLFQMPSNPMSFLGREIYRERLHGQKEVLFVSIIVFTPGPDALALMIAQ